MGAVFGERYPGFRAEKRAPRVVGEVRNPVVPANAVAVSPASSINVI